MWRMMTWVLWLLFSQNLAARQIEPFDALPALDVKHLDGTDAGSEVCPMCRYGYEAGIVWWVPAGATPAAIAERRALLGSLLQQLSSPRFRIFVVFNVAPTAAQHAAARFAHPQWAVTVRIAGRGDPLLDTPAATGDAMLYVQRRWIESYAWDALPTAGARLLTTAQHAQDWLNQWYPVASTPADPDTPKGQLWLAPNRLRAQLDVGPGQVQSWCVPADSEGAWDHALVVAGSDDSARTRFARSDARGCLHWQAPAKDEWMLALYRPGRPASTWRLANGRIDPVPNRSDADAIAHQVRGDEPVAVACEGCELAFVGLPERLSSRTRIAQPDEPGVALVLSGVVRDSAGRPAPGIVVYAHQTNAVGIYPPETSAQSPKTLHGRLRAWAITDARGRYEFQTIRPGAYPDAHIPEHIHLQIIEPARCTYYIGDVLFQDDPRLTARDRQQATVAYGGSGIVSPRRVDGVWRVQRDVALGLGVDCGVPASG